MTATTPQLARRLPAVLESKGETIVLRPGSVQLFDDPDSIWLVYDGTVELLAVQRKDGRQTGPREFLAELTAGAVIWGMDQSANRDGIHLLALSQDETRLLRFATAELRRLAGQAAVGQVLADGLNQWITGLSVGAARYISPRGTAPIPISLDEPAAPVAGERITSFRGVIWAHLGQGGGTFLDVTKVPGTGAAVPLTAKSWLAPDSVEALSFATTESVLTDPRLPGWMNSFHGWILHALAYDFRNAADMENSRLAKRAEQTAGDTTKTLSRFATLLDKTFGVRKGVAQDDALFECCSLIGHELRAPVVMPEWAKRRRTGDRPVTAEDIATASQLRVRQVVLRGRWWEQDHGPLLGFLGEEGNPVALLPRRGNRYVLRDPIAGDERPVTEDLAMQVSSLACYFYPSLPSRPIGALDLLRFGLARCRPDLAALAIAGALGGLVATGIPLATGYVFDTVIPGHQSAQIIQVGLAMLAAAFAAASFHFATDVAMLRVEGKISGTLQAAVMDRLLRLPTAFFGDYSSGDLAQRTMVIETIRRHLTGVVMGSMVAGVFSLFSFALLFFYAPVAAALATLLTAILVTAAVMVGNGLMKATMASEQLSGQINSLVLEIVSAITKLRLAGAEERAFNIWGAKFFEMREHQIGARKVMNLYRIFWSGFEILCQAAIFGTIATISGGKVSTGGFLAFIAAFSGFLTAVSALAQSLISVFAVAPLYKRASPILKEMPETDLSKADPGTLSGAVEVNGAVFRYTPDARRVLDGLTIRAEPGEFIALTGPSGCGKSTLARLLLGFERPEQGGVFFDGHDLRGLDLRRVRRQIGVVLQNGKLIPGSIYENIQGASNATLDDCWEAAARAGLDEEIKLMPMGMHTVLTDGSTALSGGQVQRILIARAIVGKPRLMIMDEATSALDNRTQAIVTESLDRLSVTRIVIAHRLSTIINADRIYVLSLGKVAESGNYQQLLEQNGMFAELVRRQQT